MAIERDSSRTNPRGEQIRTRQRKYLILIPLLVFVHLFAVRNLVLLSKDMVLGDFSGQAVFPPLRYGFTRLPADPLLQSRHAQNRLAIDFAQIYFPSQDFAALTKNYENGFLDPFQRPSRYAPAVHFVCSMTICRLDYGVASLLHMSIQITVFYVCFILAFRRLGIQKHLWLGLTVLNVCLFLTPVGLSWFERGQFSLYVGASYLLLILGLLKKTPVLVLVSALLGFAKWTSFPYLFIVITVFILASSSVKEAKRHLILAAGFFLIILIPTLLFPSQSMAFLQGLYQQERFAPPGGLSAARILPTSFAKALPIPLILLGWWMARIRKLDWSRLLPFLTGCAVATLTYPTLAHEYNLPSILGFLPLLIFWVNAPDDSMNYRNRLLIGCAFILFVLAASCSHWMNSRLFVVAEYGLISGMLLFLPLFYYSRAKAIRPAGMPG